MQRPLLDLIFSKSSHFVTFQSYLSSSTPASLQRQHEARKQVKKHLRRLYQHIHPDRLVQHPQQRLINESSFQQLQSALDAHLKPKLPDNEPGSTNRVFTSTASTTRQLTFFANKTDGSKGLIKAHIAFHESRLASVLLDLFQALGLNDPPSKSTLHAVFPLHNKSSTPTSSTKSTSTIDLRNLVDQGRKQRNPFSADPETAANMANATTTPDERRILLHALQRKYGINIELHEHITSHTLVLLRRLAGVLAFLDENKVSIRPSVIKIDAGRKAEILLMKSDLNINNEKDNGNNMKHVYQSLVPIVQLGALAPDAEWRAAVECRDVEIGCEKARAEVQQLHILQVRAAKVIGVRLMLCQVSMEATRTVQDVNFVRSYENLLRDLLVAKNEDSKYHLRGEEEVNRMRRLIALMITPDGDQVEMDESEGIIQVGLEGGVEAVRKAVVEASAMAKRFERMHNKREEEARITETLRKELRLKRLRRKEGVMTDSEWRGSLNKLRRNKARVREILAGTSVAIGNCTQLLNGEVELDWKSIDDIV